MGSGTPFDEAACAQEAYRILKKHFARAGIAVKHDELPKSWFGLSWLVSLNVAALVRQPGHSSMLRELLAELVGFTQGFSAEYFLDNLYELLRRSIEEPDVLAFVEPLLPPEALAKMGEMRKRLEEEREDARRRADEGYY